ncbi:MAG: hypothetical protein OQK98_10570 [Gammaproteobacteria bacterium]|nr:hypothetical protein [Gammaproteobacteria bacterium]
MAEWKFVVKSRNQKSREAMQGEFFANSSIDDETHALIRESIQNSLDARIRERDEPVRVRFGLSGDKPATTDMITSYISMNAWQHFHSGNSGLLDPPDINTPCNYLTYEDFGTSGLTGDVMQSDFIENSKNSFYFFMRAEGQSGKSGDERGRWGVGKFVFPHASAIRSFFMYTVRHDDQKQMMAGQCILKSHVVDDIPYTPDGWFGNFENDGFQLPDENYAATEKLCNDFGLIRKNDETGLSIVIPYVSDEFSLKGIADNVIREYFYPILKGQLEVLVEQPGESVKIDKTFLSNEFNGNGYRPDSVTQSMIDIAMSIIDIKDEERIILNCPEKPGQPKWSTRIDAELAEKIRTGLEKTDGIVALRVPLYVRRKKSQAVETCFDMYIRKDEVSGDGRPLYIREGIKIPEINSRAARGYSCLTIIEDGPIASMLGDAENPAHTEWEKNSSNYKSKYDWGPSTIDFLRSCLTSVVHLLSESEEEEDRNVLSDIFFIDQPENDDDVPDIRKQKRKKPDEGEDDPEKIKIEKKGVIRRYNLNKIEGGFAIHQAKDSSPDQYIYKVKVAYDRVKGNPWNKYSPNDFTFDENSTALKIEVDGIDQVKSARNVIAFRTTQPGFVLKVTGFDINRDIIVDVQAKEIVNEAV